MGWFIGKLLGSYPSRSPQVFRGTWLAPMLKSDIAIVNQYVDILEQTKDLTLEVLMNTLHVYNNSLHDSIFKKKSNRSDGPVRATSFDWFQSANQLLYSRLSAETNKKITALLRNQVLVSINLMDEKR